MAQTGNSNLLWTGAHWILYLRRPGEESNSGSVSLYRTSYSPVGEGQVALIAAEGDSGIAPTFCSDNPELAKFIAENVIAWRVSPFPQGLPVLDARFTRGGDVGSDPEWRIEIGEDMVVASWTEVGPPIIMERPLQSAGKAVTHSVLFFSDTAEMTVNGSPVEGEPFIREDWRGAIGRPDSSCCFALSETMVSTG